MELIVCSVVEDGQLAVFAQRETACHYALTEARIIRERYKSCESGMPNQDIRNNISIPD